MSIAEIAFQGEPGAYSESAAIGFFGDCRAYPQDNFESVFSFVQQDVDHFGIIPIENSLAGSIHRNYDLLLRNTLQIVGEYHLRVSHCLLGLPGVRLEDISEVHSHPQALAQCERRIAELGLIQVAETDTAGSARIILDNGVRSAAALASRRAAEVYNLNILLEDMEDNPANFTRFLIISQNPNNPIITSTEYKTSIVFSLNNQPGALFKALSVFALRDIDLSKIESRPVQGRPWEYLFYIDFIGNVNAKSSMRAIEHLNELAPFLRILGSYPRHMINNS
jgi:prephenate dehydratase